MHRLNAEGRRGGRERQRKETGRLTDNGGRLESKK